MVDHSLQHVVDKFVGYFPDFFIEYFQQFPASVIVVFELRPSDCFLFIFHGTNDILIDDSVQRYHADGAECKQMKRKYWIFMAVVLKVVDS